jgi:hypothetical protein
MQDEGPSFPNLATELAIDEAARQFSIGNEIASILNDVVLARSSEPPSAESLSSSGTVSVCASMRLQAIATTA